MDCSIAIKTIATINTELSTLFKKHYPYIPTPNISRYLSIDTMKLSDIAALAMHAWELSHNGMNGLRYDSYTETDELVMCISKEVCSASGEDLSCPAQYLRDAPINDAALRAYWFTRTFGNCSSISLTFMSTLKALFSHRLSSSIATHSGIDFKLSTATIKGFSLRTKSHFESKNITTNLITDPTSYHQWFESHNHVIISIQSVSGQIFALDLAGAQFGQFGVDAGHPYFILEPMDAWMQRYSSIRNDEAVMSYSDKNTLIETVTQLVVKSYPLNMTCVTCNGKSIDGSLQVCSRCRTRFYCSVPCQKIDWKNGHKEQCKK